MRERGGLTPGGASRDGGDKEPGESLAGMLLLSHPVMKDEHFKKTVVLLAAHSAKDGAMGVILNRPLGKTLGEVDSAFADTPLGNIALYEGGPVETERVIFAAWHWEAAQRRLQLHFGVDREFAEKLALESPDTHLRGFLGYAGWTKNQLEGELASNAWAVVKVSAGALDTLDGLEMWRALIGRASPELRLLADSPDEPENN